MLLAAWAADFQQVVMPLLLVLGLLTLFSLALDFCATALGAKRVGAHRPAIIGAMLGTSGGLFFVPTASFLDDVEVPDEKA